MGKSKPRPDDKPIDAPHDIRDLYDRIDDADALTPALLAEARRFALLALGQADMDLTQARLKDLARLPADADDLIEVKRQLYLGWGGLFGMLFPDTWCMLSQETAVTKHHWAEVHAPYPTWYKASASHRACPHAAAVMAILAAYACWGEQRSPDSIDDL